MCVRTHVCLEELVYVYTPAVVGRPPLTVKLTHRSDIVVVVVVENDDVLTDVASAQTVGDAREEKGEKEEKKEKNRAKKKEKEKAKFFA